MTCNTTIPGTHKGIGTSKKNFQKALVKAVQDAQISGNKSCVGGACAGGSCMFQITSMSATYTSKWNDEDQMFRVEVTADGTCACG